MAARQFGRRRGHFACQLAIGNHRPGEGHGTDEDTEEEFHPQDRDLDTVFLGQKRTKAFERLLGGVIHRQNATQLDMGDEAHEHRSQTHQRVHRRHQLRHFGHLHAFGDVVADDTACGDQDDRQQPQTSTRPDQGCQHCQRHTRNAVPNCTFCAFLPAQAAQRQDEENSRNHIGGSCKAKVHYAGLLKISGTWRACAG